MSISQAERTDRKSPFEHLIVCANPSLESFDHAIVKAYADTVRTEGQHVVIRDLYAFRFDPVLKQEERPGHGDRTLSRDVAAELAFVQRADVLVMVYPIWYGLPPAILKGYIDRVLGADYSFREFHDQKGQPSLKGKPLVSISTSGLPLTWLRDRGQVTSLREIVDVYLWRGFGMKQSQHLMIDSIVPNMSTAYAERQLERARDTARQTCAMLAEEPYGEPVFEA